MLAYNLTSLQPGITNVSGHIDVLVWAMDEGGSLPKSVEVHVEGNTLAMERMYGVLVSSADHRLISEPIAPSPKSRQVVVKVDITIEGRAPIRQIQSYKVESDRVIPEAIFAWPDLKENVSASEWPTLPDGLDPRFAYFARISLAPGTHRLRIVCTDAISRKHWVDGFSVHETSFLPTKKPSGKAEAEVEMPPWYLRSIAIGEVFQGVWDKIVFLLLRRFILTEKGLQQTMLFRMINPERLGHLAGNTEIFLAEKQVGLHGQANRKCVLFVTRHRFVEDHGWVDAKCKVANRSLLNLWSKFCWILREGMISQAVINRVERECPQVVSRSRSHGHRDIHGSLDRTAPSVTLPQEKRQKGDALLEQLGVPLDAPIVLYHCRSAEYVSSTYQTLGSSLEETRYGYRNANPHSFDESAKELARKGYYIVKVGIDSKPWHLTGSGFLDFALRRKNEWMDLYLFNRCKFFVGTTSGIYALADLFRKPIVFTNFAPLGHVYSWSPRYLTIFKKLRDLESGEIVPTSRLLGSELGWTIHWEKIPKGRYVYEDNSTEEICSAVSEMALRFETNWDEDPSALELQSRFWAMLKVDEYHCHKNSRIGSHFLKENVSWLLS